MARQLTLLSPRPGGRAAWRLDDRTREAGRKGVAEARAALAAARRPQPDGGHHPGRRTAA